MKKKNISRFIAIMIAAMLSVGFVSCSDDDDDDYGQFKSLFSKTDFFIDMLDTVYDRYDAFGSKASDTSDGKFTVTPIGRLITVKKKYSAADIPNSKIIEALSSHYKKNSKVKDVFLNNGGTITIDCRN